MIVVDASAMVEALVGDLSDALLDAMSGELSAPHLLDVEVLSTLRGLVRGRKLAESRADDARRTYAEFTIERYATASLAERIWSLRHNVTAYDASYLALAEGLDVPLITRDRKFAAAGHRAEVRVL